MLGMEGGYMGKATRSLVIYICRRDSRISHIKDQLGRVWFLSRHLDGVAQFIYFGDVVKAAVSKGKIPQKIWIVADCMSQPTIIRYPTKVLQRGVLYDELQSKAFRFVSPFGQLTNPSSTIKFVDIHLKSLLPPDDWR